MNKKQKINQPFSINLLKKNLFNCKMLKLFRNPTKRSIFVADNNVTRLYGYREIDILLFLNSPKYFE